MATQKDVRRVALALPQTLEGTDEFAFFVTNKPKPRRFAWLWHERVVPKKPRVANPEVLVLRVDGEGTKQDLLAADPEKFFTEPHYDGYPAILVRLPAIGIDELRELLTDAWCCQAPKKLVEESGL